MPDAGVTGVSVAAPDSINGGGGNDVFQYNISFNATGAGTSTAITNIVASNAFIDALNGGAGTDTLRIALGTGNPLLANLTIDESAITDWTNLVSVETIAVTGGAITGAITVDLTGGKALTAGVRNVDLSGDTSATGTNVIRVPGSATQGSSITGSAGVDQITGGAGNDVITGGAGADVITLGTGLDTLVFNSLTGSDTVADYSVADDSITLSKAVFTGLGALGALSAAEFESGAGLTAAATAAGRIVYDTTTGALYYDADGSAAGGAVQIATLTGVPALAATEFTIGA
ncbi:MAG: hypothetical protein EBS51_16905 [Planctomycetia bacterium]|nr:hypothetical protein [Planctomycetia bacterium]